jgi:hypothetical protein
MKIIAPFYRPLGKFFLLFSDKDFFRRVFVVPSFSPRAASFFIFAREEGTK